MSLEALELLLPISFELVNRNAHSQFHVYMFVDISVCNSFTYVY